MRLHAFASSALLLIASSASALTMDWTPIGNPGNVGDNFNRGAVSYFYRIGTYEVTNAQYAEFLNAKAASDPLALYNANMGSGAGGITRTGVSGSFSYGAIAGRGDMPVNYLSLYDMLRFANWMNNGQGNSSTETGAYTLLGGTATPSNGATVVRNASATVFLPNQDEWYKAAYYDPGSSSYFHWPTSSNNQVVCATPTATANRANCMLAVGDLTIKGSYTGSKSPYGTFDQGGNVMERLETRPPESPRARGGGFGDRPEDLSVLTEFGAPAGSELIDFGFRLAMIPEPSTGLLVTMGLFSLATA